MRPQYGLLLSSIALCNLAQAAPPGAPDTGATKPDTVAHKEAGEPGASTEKSPTLAGLRDRVRYTFPPASKK